MEGVLSPGQTVAVESSRRSCTVRELLGGGGQGEVYRAEVGRLRVALKWYLPGWATAEQRTALTALVKRRPPSDAFLWPLDLASASGIPGFGYIMLLRDPRFRSLTDLMRRRVEPTFRVLATAAFQLADNFLRLHSQGLCYRDISFGNVFLDPGTGDVLICDNDNVGVDGASGLGLLGTPRFMAPEVVRGEAMPSTRTDLFSLAVLLFYMFVMHHPFEGARERQIAALDLSAMTPLYGTQPIFIFDPEDESNRPVAGDQQNAFDFWSIYPSALRQLFTQAFTDGVRSADRRVQEGEWRQAMISLRDAIVYCHECGGENFVEPGESDPVAVSPSCWGCGTAVRLPLHLRFDHSVVMLNHDTELYPHHLDPTRLYDFSAPAAAITRHPTDERIWGLRNLSSQRWRATLVDGSTSEVAPDQTLRLTAGAIIRFGPTDASVGPAATRAQDGKPGQPGRRGTRVSRSPRRPAPKAGEGRAR